MKRKKDDFSEQHKCEYLLIFSWLTKCVEFIDFFSVSVEFVCWNEAFLRTMVRVNFFFSFFLKFKMAFFFLCNFITKHRHSLGVVYVDSNKLCIYLWHKYIVVYVIGGINANKIQPDFFFFLASFGVVLNTTTN